MRPTVIVGLGNPTASFVGSNVIRHNIDHFLKIENYNAKFNIDIKDNIVLAKPQTFMNLSGEAVYDLLEHYKVEPRDLIVIHDEMEKKVGIVQSVFGGSARGHNGVKNIIEKIVQRLRIGVGRPPSNVSVPSFVLSPVESSEMEILKSDAFPEAVRLLHEFIGSKSKARIPMNNENESLQMRKILSPQAYDMYAQQMLNIDDLKAQIKKKETHNKSFARWVDKMDRRVNYRVDQHKWRKG